MVAAARWVLVLLIAGLATLTVLDLALVVSVKASIELGRRQAKEIDRFPNADGSLTVVIALWGVWIDPMYEVRVLGRDRPLGVGCVNGDYLTRPSIAWLDSDTFTVTIGASAPVTVDVLGSRVTETPYDRNLHSC